MFAEEFLTVQQCGGNKKGYALKDSERSNLSVNGLINMRSWSSCHIVTALILTPIKINQIPSSSQLTYFMYTSR